MALTTISAEEQEAREQLRGRGYGYQALCTELKAAGWVVAVHLPPTVLDGRGYPLDKGCSMRVFVRPPLPGARPRRAADLLCGFAADKVSEEALDKLSVAARARMQVKGWLEPLRAS